jgi:DNA primase
MKYQFFDTYEAELPAILTAGSTHERVTLTQALIDDMTKVYFDNISSDISLTEAEQRQHLHTFFSEEMPFLSTLATKESSPLELKAARDSLYKNLMEHDPELSKEFDRVLKKRDLGYQQATEAYDLRNQSHELKTQRDELTDNGADENADNIKALDEQINELNRKAEVADRNRDFYNKGADEILEQIPETERSFLDSHIRHKDKLKMEKETKEGIVPVINDVQGVVPLT